MLVQDHPRINELTLSRIWQDGQIARELRTTDGRALQVIYRGVWSHSNGPDFLNAMIDIDGHLYRGAIEVHLRASDWLRHCHSSDTAYDEVVLHVVLNNDMDEIRTGNGRVLSTLELRSYLSSPLEQLAQATTTIPLGGLGAGPCLPTLVTRQPDLIHTVLRHAGWQRMVAKQLHFLQEMEIYPPAEVLYRGMLDALGFTNNREGMRLLADCLPLPMLETKTARNPHAALALLLGVGGFVPLTPFHTDLAGITPLDAPAVEKLARDLVNDLCVESVPSTAWSLNRVRPANHPVRRLASFAHLMRSTAGAGLLHAVLQQPLDTPSAWRAWLGNIHPPVGQSRADQIAANIIAPFLAAYAEATSNTELADAVGNLWETLPGNADDAIAKKTLRQIVGTVRFPVTRAIEVQGLHHIGRVGCANLRCFECPIAVLAARHEHGGV